MNNDNTPSSLSIGSIKGKNPLYSPQISLPTPKNSFKTIFSNYLNEVNLLQHKADEQIQKLAAGETENLHDVTLAMDEAKKSFELMLEIRNKLLAAFEQLQRL